MMIEAGRLLTRKIIHRAEQETSPEMLQEVFQQFDDQHQVVETLGLSLHQLQMYEAYTKGIFIRDWIIPRFPKIPEIIQKIPLVSKLVDSQNQARNLINQRKERWVQKADDIAKRYVEASQQVARLKYTYEIEDMDKKKEMVKSPNFLFYQDQLLNDIGTPSRIQNAAFQVVNYRKRGLQDEVDHRDMEFKPGLRALLEKIKLGIRNKPRRHVTQKQAVT